MTSRSRRTKRSPLALPLQMAELAWAAPQVVAHRVSRMAAAGAQPSARDRREFERMVAEKGAAFVESWQAMAFAGLRAQQQLAASWLSALTVAPFSPRAASRRTGSALQRSMLDIATSGLAPVHRKAVANARRLGRKKASTR